MNHRQKLLEIHTKAVQLSFSKHFLMLIIIQLQTVHPKPQVI